MRLNVTSGMSQEYYEKMYGALYADFTEAYWVFSVHAVSPISGL